MSEFCKFTRDIFKCIDGWLWMEPVREGMSSQLPCPCCRVDKYTRLLACACINMSAFNEQRLLRILEHNDDLSAPWQPLSFHWERNPKTPIARTMSDINRKKYDALVNDIEKQLEELKVDWIKKGQSLYLERRLIALMKY